MLNMDERLSLVQNGCVAAMRDSRSNAALPLVQEESGNDDYRVACALQQS
jgi:hypothetical protein